MSRLIQSDDFDVGSGTLATPWTLRTGSYFTLTGDRVQSDIQSYPGATTLPAAPSDARAILQAFDPYASLTVSGGTRIVSFEVQIVTPAVLSSSSTAQAGLVLFSSGAASVPHFELLWSRTSGGSNSLALYRRTSAGAQVLVFNAGSITAVAASELHTIKAVVTIANSAEFLIAVYWDGAFQGSTIITSATMATWGFSGGSQTNPHYAGIFATTPGPTHQSGPNAGPTWVLDNPIYFDGFRVRDLSPALDVPMIYAAPTLTAATTLATIAVESEDDSTGDTFTLPPSWAIEIPTQGHRANEHPFDAGYTQTVAITEQRRRQWRLGWNALSAAQRSTFETHVAAVTGRKKAFDWTDPETGAVITVRFIGNPSFELLGIGVSRATAEIEEVLGA